MCSPGCRDRELAEDATQYRVSQVDPATNSVVHTLDLFEYEEGSFSGGIKATSDSLYLGAPNGELRVAVPSGT